MLRLFESRTGQVVGVRSGLLRLYVLSPDDLRVCLVADLLRRLAKPLHRPTLATAAHDIDHSYLNIPPLDAGEPHRGSLSVGNVTSDAYLPVSKWTSPEVSAVDPVALRLALLEHHYRHEAHLSPESVTAAAARLDGWRRAIAAWATVPSRPMSGRYAEEALGAFCDDLDTPAVLVLLDRMAADASLEPGAKFETAMHIDLVLGIDLADLVGRV